MLKGFRLRIGKGLRIIVRDPGNLALGSNQLLDVPNILPIVDAQ